MRCYNRRRNKPEKGDISIDQPRLHRGPYIILMADCSQVSQEEEGKGSERQRQRKKHSEKWHDTANFKRLKKVILYNANQESLRLRCALVQAAKKGFFVNIHGVPYGELQYLRQQHPRCCCFFLDCCPPTHL